VRQEGSSGIAEGGKISRATGAVREQRLKRRRWKDDRRGGHPIFFLAPAGARY
jgi:hypothetical protein